MPASIKTRQRAGGLIRSLLFREIRQPGKFVGFITRNFG